MKVLVVTLALIVFTGSQAFVLRDESKSKAAELEEELEDCFTNLFRTIYGKANMVIESESFMALNPWFNAVEKKLQQRSYALQDAFPAEVHEADSQLRRASLDMVFKVYNEMHALGRNLTDKLLAFHEALKSDLNPVLEKLDPYTKALHQSLVRTCEELDQKLTEVLKPPLEKLQPLAKEIPGKLQEVENSLNPIVDWMQKSIITEVEKVHDVLQQSAARVLGVINKYKESFNQWIQSPIFPVDH